MWRTQKVHLHPVKSLGQSPKLTGVGLCQLSALSWSRLPCHSQSSGPARPAGLRTTNGLSGVRIPKPKRSPTGVSPQEAFGTRSLDRSSHVQPGGLYNQSPWCWVGGEGRTPSLFQRLSFLSWVDEARRFHSQIHPWRLPLSSPFVPTSPASGESEGPVQQSRQAQRGGPLLAPVPATATAWQQRAPGSVAINNPPAAAAVRQPAALGGKCGALSAPARGASTELSGKYSKHLPVLLNCLA